MQAIRKSGKLRQPMINFNRSAKERHDISDNLAKLAHVRYSNKSQQAKTPKAEETRPQRLKPIPKQAIPMIGRTLDISQEEQDYIIGFAEVKPWQNIRLQNKL